MGTGFPFEAAPIKLSRKGGCQFPITTGEEIGFKARDPQGLHERAL
ncbi:hypothetical protein CES85_2722 [Ochrobactrum quorumnocens]|uniref:Uncharacterized protein n=1 Tax=Ochrobactrum quorumnocens TaxID=271865 RepID=A0A248ULG2_9HYPH|nr:hypothetical protein CES85_2722 [[Ochrobactrum] quorumnocens]